MFLFNSLITLHDLGLIITRAKLHKIYVRVLKVNNI